MKALSIRQPWAYQILHGEKKIEYRNWATDYRGQLLICTSKTWDDEDMVKPDAQTVRTTYPMGVAFCVVDLVGIESRVEYDDWDGKNRVACDWHLANPRPVKQFPVKGKLHLFDVPDEMIEFL